MLPAVFALAVVFHAGSLALVEYLRPEPLPRLIIKFSGKGAGIIKSIPGGMSCTDNCSAEFEPGTEIQLSATVGDGSTFEGWSGQCTPRPDWVLDCNVDLRGDAVVEVSFGLVPERVDVAMMETQPSETERELEITLPHPDIEAEFLTEPLEDLLAELEPEPPQPEQPQPQQPPVAQAEPAPAPQPEPQINNLRSVEVPDQNEVEEAPDDATHLSDKNRDVAEEIHARDTNLEREQAGETPYSEKSDVDSEEIGAEEAEIAQLEDAEATTLEQIAQEIRETGEHDRAVGAVVGEGREEGEEGEEGDDRPAEKPGVLAMRGIEGRGRLAADDSTGEGGKAGKRGKRGKWGIDTQLEFEDYERIVGKDKVQEELALGRNKKKSKKRGRWAKKQAALRAALENFTPEVKPGNQTALKTRAAPFAVYIARMHRRIHELWGFGFLEDLDGKPADHPLNNWELYTVLEIVIDPDGSVVADKIRIVHNSGRLEFDVAAIDTIITASPYEPTPKKIRSPDGRVYMHWGFYRNHRQCGTFNAQPYILAEAPKDADAGALKDADLVRNIPRRARQKRLEQSRGGAGSGDAGSGDAGSGDADSRRGGPQGAPRATGNVAGLPGPDDPQAVHAANLWLSAFSQGNVSKMISVTGTPFRSGARFTASTAAEVATIYNTLRKESRGRVLDMKVMSPAGYRKRFGAVPEGIELGKRQLLAVVRMPREQFTLVLDRQDDGSYKIIGLHR